MKKMLGILVLGLMFSAFSVQVLYAESSPPEISDIALVADYQNAAAADAKYLGENIIVRGFIREVEKDSNDIRKDWKDRRLVVVLSGAGAAYRVKCKFFEFRPQIEALQIGQFVRIGGNCQGCDFTHAVILDNCYFPSQ